MTTEIQSLDAIIADNLAEPELDDEEMEEEADLDSQIIPSRNEALSAIDTIRRYFQMANVNASETEISKINSLEFAMILNSATFTVQTTLDSFFIRN